MSLIAMGWGSRQKVGSVALKATLLLMCERLDDESGVAWPSVAWLADRTEQDERTVRKALKALTELGHLVDTGRRVGQQKNVVVWKLPLFDAWLAEKSANPDKNVGVRTYAQPSNGQTTEVDGETTASNTGNPQPLQNCQGSFSPTPSQGNSTLTNLHGNPDKNVPATPTNLSGDSSPVSHFKDSKSAGARATPSGARAAQPDPNPTGKGKTHEQPVFDDAERLRFWKSTGVHVVLGEASLFGLISRYANFADLPPKIRMGLLPHIDRWAEWAVDREIERALAFKTIEERVREELRTEMRAFKPATFAERGSASVAA